MTLEFRDSEGSVLSGTESISSSLHDPLSLSPVDPFVPFRTPSPKFSRESRSFRIVHILSQAPLREWPTLNTYHFNILFIPLLHVVHSHIARVSAGNLSFEALVCCSQ